MKKYKQFILFICTGGVAALVNIISRVLLSYYLAFEFSVVIAYLFAIITAYSLAKIFVFKNKKVKTYRSFAIFFLVNIFAIFQTWIVSIFLRNYLFEIININSNRDLFAHIVGVCVPVFSSYYGHKYLTFNNNWRIKN